MGIFINGKIIFIIMQLVHGIRLGSRKKLCGILDSGTIKMSTVIQAIGNDFPYRIQAASAFFICEGYVASYSSYGVIFETDTLPHLWSPVDVQHLKCNDTLPSEIEQFQFKTLDELLRKFPDSEKAGIAIELWKRKNGSAYGHPKGYRTVPSEVVFLTDINIRPLATYGFPNENTGLPNYEHARDFFNL